MTKSDIHAFSTMILTFFEIFKKGWTAQYLSYNPTYYSVTQICAGVCVISVCDMCMCVCPFTLRFEKFYKSQNHRRKCMNIRFCHFTFSILNVFFKNTPYTLCYIVRAYTTNHFALNENNLV